MNKSKLKNKNEKGITLIALVITIIVLLILAGVAINMAIDSNGLFGKANDAVESWETARQKEQTEIQKLLDKLGIDATVEISEEIPANWDSAKVDKVVVQGDEKAPVPKGFTVSAIEGENTITGGLVIYKTGDANTEADGFWTAKDTADNKYLQCQTTYDQYVWIPVDDINQMVMCKSNNKDADAEGNKICNIDLVDGVLKCTNTGHTANATNLCGRLYGLFTNTSTKPYTTSMNFADRTQTWGTSAYREPDILTHTSYGDASADGITGITAILQKEGKTYEGTITYDTIKADWLKLQEDDFKNMATSVKKYGGFYVSRYEAGVNGASKTNQVVITASSSDNTVRKGLNNWYGLYKEVHNKIALGESTMQSHMIYGSQYDQIINFIGSEAQTGHSDKQLKTQGLTGANGNDIMKNIYDLEGNNTEWTVQATNIWHRVNRGGNYNSANSGNFYPASNRNSYYPTSTFDDYTTRSSLYL